MYFRFRRNNFRQQPSLIGINYMANRSAKVGTAFGLEHFSPGLPEDYSKISNINAA